MEKIAPFLQCVFLSVCVHASSQGEVSDTPYMKGYIIRKESLLLRRIRL